MPMMTAVRMPGMAEGTSTWTMVCHLVQPRPNDPSRYESGTAAMASVASEVTVGRIMNARTRELERMPYPVPPAHDLVQGTTIERPTSPKTTDGMPTRSSIMGRKIRLPKPGAMSTTKSDAPSAKGSERAHESRVTENDPAIIGRAPTSGTPEASFWWGFHVVPPKKEPRGIPSVTKVARPCEHTMKMRVHTRATTSATAEPVRILPRRSMPRLSVTFAMSTAW